MTNIINYGISETLKSLFVQLKETPGLSGYKYHQKDVEQICQAMICRNYGSLCYELSFLCWAVVHHPNYQSSALLKFFWIQENIKPKAFRQAFRHPIQTTHGNIKLTENYLSLSIDSLEFAISPTRISVLAVMLEVIATIDPSQLTKIETLLLNATSQSIKQLSSELQKLIYAFLKEHIPKASTQERFRAISDWLKQHKLTANRLSDEHVLNFWLNPPAQPSYIKYSTVVDDLLDAVSAILEVENHFNADYALSLGSNQEQGEVDAQWVQQSIFEQTLSLNDFDSLCQSPKFLTLAQYEPIKAILNHGKMARQLPLSFLRLAIFSSWQAVLIQSKRKSAEVLADKLTQTPERNYQDFIDEIHNAQMQNAQVQQAIAHIFYTLKSPLFVGIMLRQLSPGLQQNLKTWTSSQLTSKDEHELDYFLLIQRWVEQNPEAQQWLNAAEKSFKNNNKDGFKTLPLEADLDSYQDGSDILSQSHQLIQAYLLSVEKPLDKNNGLMDIYRSDLCIFSNRFKHIYGAPDV